MGQYICLQKSNGLNCENPKGNMIVYPLAFEYCYALVTTYSMDWSHTMDKASRVVMIVRNNIQIPLMQTFAAP